MRLKPSQQHLTCRSHGITTPRTSIINWAFKTVLIHTLCLILCRKWFSETLKELEKLLKREDAGQYLALYSTSVVFIFDKIDEVRHISLHSWFNLVLFYMALNLPLPTSSTYHNPVIRDEVHRACSWLRLNIEDCGHVTYAHQVSLRLLIPFAAWWP